MDVRTEIGNLMSIIILKLNEAIEINIDNDLGIEILMGLSLRLKLRLRGRDSN